MLVICEMLILELVIVVVSELGKGRVKDLSHLDLLFRLGCDCSWVIMSGLE